MGVSINTNPSPVLLWKNPNEDSGANLPSFAPQTISIPNLSDYKAIDIVFCMYDREDGVSMRYYLASKISKYIAFNAYGSDTQGFYINTHFRTLTIADTSISFDDAKSCRPTVPYETQNLYMIPLRIYGIK